MEELKIRCTHRNRIDKLTQIQNIQETHAHTKPSAIKIIRIDNMAKHTEKHVGKLCCFESRICKLDRNHMCKSRIGNTLRISHTHTKVTLKNADTNNNKLSHRKIRTYIFCVFFRTVRSTHFSYKKSTRNL